MSRKAVLTYVAPLAIGLASEAALHGSLHAVDLKSFISITEKTVSPVRKPARFKNRPRPVGRMRRNARQLICCVHGNSRALSVPAATTVLPIRQGLIATFGQALWVGTPGFRNGRRFLVNAGCSQAFNEINGCAASMVMRLSRGKVAD